ncbi:NADPH-dependent oxidoreductase [Acetobacteraceae bacterium ESL0709]|nr:NADPH-dependent oxidoreductase [Acetobacteraceae bacterium ESL0697]MDF7678807.1 NADPH-dependent oxidoreductase [Acetobacteraceae bacterium ESL0709]
MDKSPLFYGSDVHQLWQERYREDASGTLPDNEVLRVQLSHQSVRNYRTDPLPEGALEAGIAAASSAASSCNMQNWSVIVVTDPQKRAKLAELAGKQDFIKVAPVFLAWIVDHSRLVRLARHEGLVQEALDYEEAHLMAVLDTGLAAQNAVTAFESMGLGTVYIGGLRNHVAEVAALLELPPRAYAVVGMCVGYPAKDEKRHIKPRLSQDVVVHKECYDATGERARITEYDRKADAYQEEQGLPSRLWSQVTAKRISTIKGLDGRHVMRSVLNQLGFPLK